MKTLSEHEIDEVLKQHSHWKLHAKKFTREWVFEDFVAAITFVNRVAELAEGSQHHPDIDIRYNRVILALESHDAGGLTSRDASMVGKIDEMFL